MSIMSKLFCRDDIGIDLGSNVRVWIRGVWLAATLLVAPHACAPHPYYCTAEVWQDVTLTCKYDCGLAAICTLMVWPFTVIDEVCETVENRFGLFSTVWKRGFQRIDKALRMICRSVSDLPRLLV